MTGGNTSTIEFGDGGGTLAIAADGEYNATEGMNTKINIVSAGTYIVHTDDHE